MKKFEQAKLKISILITVLILILSSCSTPSKLSSDTALNSIESKFVGSWAGNEIIHKFDAPRYWIQHRFEDGTFILINTILYDGEVINLSIKGKWWIKDGLFYERPSSAKKDDVYEFEIIDKDHIRFIGIGMEDLSKNNEKYEFIDTRVEFME